MISFAVNFALLQPAEDGSLGFCRGYKPFSFLVSQDEGQWKQYLLNAKRILTNC